MLYRTVAMQGNATCNSNHIELGIKIESLCSQAFSMSDCNLSLSERDRLISDCASELHSDLLANHARDPAVRHAPIECLLSVYAPFFAVLSYRLAATLCARACETGGAFLVEAMRLSYSARSRTGVEIHPEATIGKRFIIDHGWGTIIGQTVTLGDDAYILNNVVLGGRSVADAADGKRHPTIGHRVQISGGVRILGPVMIGDDCFIGPDAVVTKDLPSNSKIGPRRRGCDDRTCHLTGLSTSNGISAEAFT